MTTPQIPWSGYFLILNQDGKLMDLSGITLPTGDELMIYDSVNGDDLVVNRRANDGTETELRFSGRHTAENLYPAVSHFQPMPRSRLRISMLGCRLRMTLYQWWRGG